MPCSSDTRPPRWPHVEPIREHPAHTLDDPQARTPMTPVDHATRPEPFLRRQ